MTMRLRVLLAIVCAGLGLFAAPGAGDCAMARRGANRRRAEGAPCTPGRGQADCHDLGRKSLNFGMPDVRKSHRPNVRVGS